MKKTESGTLKTATGKVARKIVTAVAPVMLAVTPMVAQSRLHNRPQPERGQGFQSPGRPSMPNMFGAFNWYEDSSGIGRRDAIKLLTWFENTYTTNQYYEAIQRERDGHGDGTTIIHVLMAFAPDMIDRIFRYLTPEQIYYSLTIEDTEGQTALIAPQGAEVALRYLSNTSVFYPDDAKYWLRKKNNDGKPVGYWILFGLGSRAHINHGEYAVAPKIGLQTQVLQMLGNQQVPFLMDLIDLKLIKNVIGPEVLRQSLRGYPEEEIDKVLRGLEGRSADDRFDRAFGAGDQKK